MKYIQIKDPKEIILVSDELSYDGGINWQSVKANHPDRTLGDILKEDSSVTFRRRVDMQKALEVFYEDIIDTYVAPLDIKGLALVTNHNGKMFCVHEPIYDGEAGVWYSSTRIKCTPSEVYYYNGDVTRNGVRIHWTESKLTFS